MSRLVLLSCGMAMISCSPMPESRITQPTPHPEARDSRTSADFLKPVPQAPTSRPVVQPPAAVLIKVPQKRIPLAYHHTSRNGVVLSMVSFDARVHQLRIADQQNGLGSRWTDAKSAAATYRGLAAINGGFFTSEGKPLGLLIETGTKRGYVNKSSLGAGMFVSSKTGSVLIRRERYASSSLAANAYNLLQTGPMLTESAKPISGLTKTNSRPRSFIAWDGKNHWAMGYAEPCTLDALSKALAGTSPAGFKIQTAVNLDGGRSSDLWVGSHVKNGNKTHRTFLNKTVRNYLVLIPR